MSGLDEVKVVSEPSQKYLNQRQLLDYRSQREACLRWLLTFGKDPDRGEGYALGTVKPRSSRMDMFYRWVWDEIGGYTSNVSHEHADEWMRELALSDASTAHKSNCQKSVQMLFKWRHHEKGESKWDPEIKFSSDGSSSPRDYLTREERAAIREAALEYGSVPSYGNLTPEERVRWKRYLAQRFEKPKSEIVPTDWDRANAWKIPSLVWTSLDVGLRPVEVASAEIAWVDTENELLRIPKEESAKNTENWLVSLRSQTAEALERWLSEREAREKYDEADKLWLTRNSNPYSTSSLRYLLYRLCEIVGIDTEHRKMSWYSIRHSVGTYMTREEDLAATQAQLRHKSPRTTMKYDQAPVEDRRNALDRMG